MKGIDKIQVDEKSAERERRLKDRKRRRKREKDIRVGGGVKERET